MGFLIVIEVVICIHLSNKINRATYEFATT